MLKITFGQIVCIVVILIMGAAVWIDLSKSEKQEKQIGTYEITNLPGSAEFQPAAGYQVKALRKDPNDGYVPYLSIALSEVRNAWLRENETVVAVIPCKYDKSGDLQSIWVATKR